MGAPPMTPEELGRYDEDKRPALVGSMVVFLFLCNLSVFARCWTQLRTAKRVFVDDIAIVVAAVCVDVVIGNLLAASHYGLGLHTYRINTEDSEAPRKLTRVFMHVWVTMVFTGPTFTAIKFSLLWFYRRLFLVHQRWLRVAWWANLIYMLLWLVGSTAYYLFQCIPSEWYWLQYYQKYKENLPGSIKHGQCYAQSSIHTALPLVFGLISDIAILLLPVAALCALQMNAKKKIALLALFSVGALACTLELVRIITLWIGTDDKNDPAWSDTNFLILSAAEEVTAIICACLPVVGPQLFKMVVQLWDSERARTRTSWFGCSSQGRRAHRFKRFTSSEEDNAGDSSRRLPLHDIAGTAAARSGTTLHLGTLGKAQGMGPARHSADEEVPDARDASNAVFVRTDVEISSKKGNIFPSNDPLTLTL